MFPKAKFAAERLHGNFCFVLFTEGRCNFAGYYRCTSQMWEQATVEFWVSSRRCRKLCRKIFRITWNESPSDNEVSLYNILYYVAGSLYESFFEPLMPINGISPFPRWIKICKRKSALFFGGRGGAEMDELSFFPLRAQQAPIESLYSFFVSDRFREHENRLSTIWGIQETGTY